MKTFHFSLPAPWAGLIIKVTQDRLTGENMYVWELIKIELKEVAKAGSFYAF